MGLWRVLHFETHPYANIEFQEWILPISFRKKSVLTQKERPFLTTFLQKKWLAGHPRPKKYDVHSGPI